MIRVAIVAGSPRLRSELGDVLRESGRFEVMGGIRDEMDSSAPLGSHDGEIFDAADVVLTDSASTATLATRAFDDSHAGLVLLSDEEDLLSSLRPFRSGVALLPTTATTEQILAAIEGAAAGLMILHADHAGPFTAAPTADRLTPREREVLHMLAAGLGNKEIANRLHISDHTSKFHVSQILSKLNAVSRAEAVSIAMRRGLVPL